MKVTDKFHSVGETWPVGWAYGQLLKPQNQGRKQVLMKAF